MTDTTELKAVIPVMSPFQAGLKGDRPQGVAFVMILPGAGCCLLIVWKLRAAIGGFGDI